MDLSKISVTSLREILKLSERKEKLLSELRSLEEQLVAHLGGSLETKSTPSQEKRISSSFQEKKKEGGRAPRGSMKIQVLEALREAGPTGMKVPDIAQKIGVKAANVHVWFSNTGKKLPEIERIGAGCFRIRH